MGVGKKGRRKIVVDGVRYVWYIALDNESSFHVLNIISDDKSLILGCPLKASIPYVISKGTVFQGERTDGHWNRYLLPFRIPEEIAPRFVSNMISWATHGEQAIHVSWNPNDVPV